MSLYAWVTDLHYCYTTLPLQEAFFKEIAARDVSGLFITGDISNDGEWEEALASIRRAVSCPIYFVLGNHDYYHHSIKQTRIQVGSFLRQQEGMYYLSQSPVIPLSNTVALVGHDGWGDGRCGDYASSTVSLKDFFCISELKGINQEERLQVLHRLGDEAVLHLRQRLIEALADYKSVIVLTHVPPFEVSCRHGGAVTDKQWSPFFVCQVLGEMLFDVMKCHQDRQLLTLCGHSHEEADELVLPNLRVITGKGVLEGCCVERWLDLESGDWQNWAN